MKLMATDQPDASILSILEGLVVLFAPSKGKLDWNEARKHFNGDLNRFLTMLRSYNKDRISQQQVNRLQTILAREECEPERLRGCSQTCYDIFVWLKALVQYTTVRQKPK